MAVNSTGLPLLGLLPDGREVSFPGDAHLFTVARSGAGKNRCVVFPNLIRHPGSMLVLDPKGESATFTARWRNEVLGQRVHVFDPFGIIADKDLPASGRATFDLIAFILRADEPFSGAQMVAEACVIPGGEKDSHWVGGSQLTLAATSLFVATSPVLDLPSVAKALGANRRSMRTVWGIIKDKRYSGLQYDMVQSENPIIAAAGAVLSGFEMGMVEKDGKVVPGLVPVKNSKENSSIISTLTTQCTGTFSSDKIMDALEGGTVNFGTLQKVPSTVYICLPGKLASVHTRFMRLLIRCALSDIEDAGLTYPMPDGSRRPSTVFVLDEFATLGRFPVVVEAMGRMRGYGLKFWTFVQNLSQLKGHYGDDWQQIPGNAGVVQYFGGTMDGFTAEWVSKKTGEKTAVATGRGSSTAPASGVSTNESTFGRPVVFPGEVEAFPDGKQILKFLGGSGEGKDRVYKADMMYRDNPDHFPDFVRHLASPERQRPVYQPKPKPAPSPDQPAPPELALKDRMVIYCPADGQSLRVPTNRGPIRVKCGCGHSWNWSPPVMVAASGGAPVSAPANDA
jgi:type IV secretion system protein VirD4